MQILPGQRQSGPIDGASGAQRLVQRVRGLSGLQSGLLIGTAIVLCLLIPGGVLKAISVLSSPDGTRDSRFGDGGRTMSGGMSVVGSSSDVGDLIATSDGSCSVYKGYTDIRKGASVTVYDSKGEIVGTSTLDAGRWQATFGDDFGRCTFPFLVRNLPESVAYQVEVSHRGKVTVAPEDLFTVGLTLGN